MDDIACGMRVYRDSVLFVTHYPELPIQKKKKSTVGSSYGLGKERRDVGQKFVGLSVDIQYPQPAVRENLESESYRSSSPASLT